MGLRSILWVRTFRIFIAAGIAFLPAGAQAPTIRGASGITLQPPPVAKVQPVVDEYQSAVRRRPSKSLTITAGSKMPTVLRRAPSSTPKMPTRKNIWTS
ncbi:MAG: hypothetical protein WA324_08610 [Bryobacteraceae bacterium]